MKRITVFIIAAILAVGCSNGSTGDNKQESTQAPAETESAGQAEEEQAETGEENLEVPPVSENVVTDDGFDQFAPPEQGETIAILKTSKGDIKIKFFEEDAPKSVENFITHSKNGYYDNLTFCRVVKDFVIQAGSPTNDYKGGESIWGDPFEDEFSARLHNYRGAVSMANSGANTNGSQFFIVQAGSVDDDMAAYLQSISEYTDAMYQDYRTLEIISGAQRFTQKAVDTYKNVGGTPFLDGGFPSEPERRSWHTVFGQVFEGMNIVDEISAGETNDEEIPIDPVVITDIEITTY